MERVPMILVVFGATGDLMHRKLMPAVYRLLHDGHIGHAPHIIGIGRRDIGTSRFVEMMETSVREAAGDLFDRAVWNKISSHIHYEQGFFEDTKLYSRLSNALKESDKNSKSPTPRFFYLATPPAHYETILTMISTKHLAPRGDNVVRVLIEKPFGKDLITARKLEKLLSSLFTEAQIYRIDHYLDKETVQNILALRFANGIFEPTWNAQFIDHVQISLLEHVGVGNRGAFYEGVGALRDVVQNHVLQMLAFTAMDRPKAFDSKNLRTARQYVFASLKTAPTTKGHDMVIRGQYEGYREEKDVTAHSTTETYVALKLFVDTPRWRGVPFYLRTGKSLRGKVTEISLHFKKPVVCTGPLCLFPEPQVMRNVLVIRVSPDTGVGLRLMAKAPGLGMSLRDIQMHEHRDGLLAAHGEYEKLLLDAIRGDQTLFAHSSEVEASWSFITKILNQWAKTPSDIHTYKPGSLGPKEAEKLIEADGRHWFLHED